MSAEFAFSQEIQTEKEKEAVRYKDKLSYAVIAKSEKYNSTKAAEVKTKIIEEIKFRNFSNEKKERNRFDIVSSSDKYSAGRILKYLCQSLSELSHSFEQFKRILRIRYHAGNCHSLNRPVHEIVYAK